MNLFKKIKTFFPRYLVKFALSRNISLNLHTHTHTVCTSARIYDSKFTTAYQKERKKNIESFFFNDVAYYISIIIQS